MEATRLKNLRNEYARLDVGAFPTCAVLLKKEIVEAERRARDERSDAILATPLFVPPAWPIEEAQVGTIVAIPVEQYPGYNFRGRLVGPGGATVQAIERQSGCRIRVRGAKSSQHVLITFAGPAACATACMASAETLVRALLVPPEGSDALKTAQLKEVARKTGRPWIEFAK
jgi:hypothetical protein